MKKRNATLDGFRKLRTDYISIYERVVIRKLHAMLQMKLLNAFIPILELLLSIS
jgi:hypothetical protein